MRSTLPVLALVLNLLSLPSALAGPACSRRLKNRSDCIAECSAKWGWPGAVMGTDRWGSVMSPSESQSVSEAIASACGTVDSSSGGALAGAPSSSSISTLSFMTLAASSSSSACPSATTTSIVTSVSTVTATVQSCPVASSSTSSSSSSSRSSSSTISTSSSSSTSTTSTSSHSTTPSTTSSATTSTTSSRSSSTSTSTSTTTVPTTATSTSSTSTASSTTTSAGTSSSDIASYLQYHNSVRAQHGASALSWNTTLANAAQSWANKCVFQHSGGSLGPYGENLAAGTGSGYGIQQAVQSWTNEASQYNASNPQPSHYTQVVWKATTQLGCAVASCNGIFPASYGPAAFYVCEYFVQGNVIGEFPQNVQ